MNLICLVVDRLHAGYLGCYGNTWITTPAFDELASESILFEQAVIESPRLAEFYASAWQGNHSLERQGRPSLPPNAQLPKRLAEAGFKTLLVTDEPWLAEGERSDTFQECLAIAHHAPSETAADQHESHLGHVFALAGERLATARPGFAMWLHTQGLGSPWDAPLAYRNRYADAEDPTPPTWVEVPCEQLPPDVDPDVRLGLAQAYAGQVTLLDQCLGDLLDLLHAQRLLDDTVLMVLSSRGFPLGEHGLVGAFADALHGELVHIPWLLRLPGGASAAARSQALVQPCDLAPTINEACGFDPGELASGAGNSLLPLVRGESREIRDRACLMAGPDEHAIRTAGWFLRVSPSESGAPELRRRLYTKPEDLWEVNDVADRASEVVGPLSAAYDEFAVAAPRGHLDSMPPLDEALREPPV